MLEQPDEWAGGQGGQMVAEDVKGGSLGHARTSEVGGEREVSMTSSQLVVEARLNEYCLGD